MLPFTRRPMDLANMRSLAVTKVMAYCKCGHEVSIDVSDLPAEASVPEIRKRLKCTKCGDRPMETGRTGANTTLQARWGGNVGDGGCQRIPGLSRVNPEHRSAGGPDYECRRAGSGDGRT